MKKVLTDDEKKEYERKMSRARGRLREAYRLPSGPARRAEIQACNDDIGKIQRQFGVSRVALFGDVERSR